MTTRDAILQELRQQSAPLHPGAIAARLRLHVGTVRRHVEVLEHAGLVERHTEERDVPGRPRVTYTAARTPGDDMAGCAGYRFVSESLAEWIEHTSDDPGAVARDVGQAWGRHLVNARPFTRTDRAAAVRQVFEILDGLGYAPNREVDGGTAIELGRRPFARLTEEHPDVGCGLHIGTVQGALASLGADVEVGDTELWPGRPDVPCRVELVTRTAERARTGRSGPA